MSKNEYARLKEEADIARVVQYLGIEVSKKGSAYFIHCPLPEHNDQHATNCYFREGWNNVYCTVCCKAVNAIDLIILETGMDYGEAADLLWELEGRPDWYYGNWKKKSPFFLQLILQRKSRVKAMTLIPLMRTAISYVRQTI